MRGECTNDSIELCNAPPWQSNAASRSTITDCDNVLVADTGATAFHAYDPMLFVRGFS